MAELTKLEVIYAVLFDLFAKESIDTIVKQLNQDTGTIGAPNPLMVQFGTQTIHSINENRIVWKINNLESFLGLCFSAAQKEELGGNLSKAKECISGISLLGIDSSELPYFVLTMSISIDVSKIDKEKIFQEMPSIVHSLRVYFEQLQGIHTTLVTYKPNTPCVIYIGYEVAQEFFEEIRNQCFELERAYTIPDTATKLKTILDRSTSLLAHFPFNSLQYVFHSISSLHELDSNVIVFTGHWEQPAFGGLNDPFIVTFTDNSSLLKPRFDELTYTGLYTKFDLIFMPEDGITSLISLISLRIWLTYLLKVVIKDSRFVDHTKKISNAFEIHDKKTLRNLITDLNKAGSTFVELASNIEDFKRTIESNTIQLSNKKYLGVPIISKTALRFSEYGFSTKSYFEKVKDSIDSTLNELTKMLNQKINAYENFNVHISDIVNLDIQSSLSKYTLISTLSGVAAVIAAIVAIFISSR